MIPCQGTHGSRQQINNKSIHKEYKIYFFVAKGYGYLVHQTYQGAKKGKQVPSSTKWGLGESVVLRLMECLTPTVSFYMFKDNYFTSFLCLPTLESTTFEQQVCSTKIGYANARTLETNSCKKKELGQFEQCSAHLTKKLCNLCGWLER